MSWELILKNYVSIADDLMRQLESFKPQIVGSVGKKDSPKDIDLLFPEDTEFSALRNKLEKLGWKLRYADEDEFNGELFWNFEKKINDDFVGLDVFLGEMQ
jgi:hypothetical protein|tara:strand:+ start:2505 stop:2807 length:303 start_codon:yes stop_codon:yes gene_type:complete